MFTEISGNTDLYAQAPCACWMICRETCFHYCGWDFPSLWIQADDLVAITGDAMVNGGDL